jgi:hypothetical protein
MAGGAARWGSVRVRARKRASPGYDFPASDADPGYDQFSQWAACTSQLKGSEDPWSAGRRSDDFSMKSISSPHKTQLSDDTPPVAMSLKKPSTPMVDLPVRSSPRCEEQAKKQPAVQFVMLKHQVQPMLILNCVLRVYEIHESFRKASGGEQECSQLSVAGTRCRMLVPTSKIKLYNSELNKCKPGEASGHVSGGKVTTVGTLECGVDKMVACTPM